VRRKIDSARTMPPLRFFFMPVQLMFAVACSCFGHDAHSQTSLNRANTPKVETVGPWKASQGGLQIPLWPPDVPLARPDSGDRPEATGTGSSLVGGKRWHWVSYVTRPTMTIYQPKGRHSGATILVIPGGGFHAVATDLEGTEICEWIVLHGMTCAMLKYRTPQVWASQKGQQQRPKALLGLEDAQRAMMMLRQQALSYGIDPHKIGVIGFSAGAYLAADLSNAEHRVFPATDAVDEQSTRPNFAVLAYTARLWDDRKGRNDLALRPWVNISAKAPPTLIVHAINDKVDDIRHPMAYALALNDAGVPVDMRVYAKGGHAFGMRPTTDPITSEWPGQLKQWLQSLGML
jgi:acetyl esterase/lipase